MTVQSGTAGSVIVGTVVVGRVKEWNLSFSRKTAEITGMGMVAEEHIPTTYGYTGSFSTAKDVADAGEVALKASALGVGTVGLKLYEGTALYTIGTAILTGMTPKLAYDGESTNAYDFKASGTLT
jgi:hypothetical protein